MKIIKISESILDDFNFEIMSSRVFKSGFFIIGKITYVNITITYNYKSGFTVDILPNKGFIGIAVDIAPFDFTLDSNWEVRLINIIRLAIKRDRIIERQFLINDKFREITKIRSKRELKEIKD
jgi:hypothetical protein